MLNPIVPHTLGTVDRKINFLNVFLNFLMSLDKNTLAYDRFSCINYTKKVWSGYNL